MADSGDLDATFVPAGFSTEGVQALGVTPMGKVLAGGWVSAKNSSDEDLQGLVQLNDDGTLDPAFGVPGTVAMVSALAISADESVVVAGAQTNGLNAVVRKLTPEGALDPSLDLVVGATITPWIYALLPQSDGKLLVAGSFNRVNSLPRTNLFRVNADGSLDTTFRTNFTSGGGILALARQSDGRVLIGGYFTNVLGTVRRGIARLNSDGSLDTSFNPGTGVQGLVKAIRVEADGRILIGGQFYSVNGVLRSCLARLTSSGAVDAAFSLGDGATLDGLDSTRDGPSVDAIALQGDGRIVVAGVFDRFGGLDRKNLARLHWDGSIDDAFDPGEGPDAAVRALAIDGAGNLLIAGDFTTVSGQDRPGVARLESDGTLPVLPIVITSPADQSVIVGRSVSFAVEATGTPALRYQWLKAGLPIANQTNRVLAILASQFSDAGRYSVAVVNDAGEVTSESAVLAVSPVPVLPTLTGQPSGAMVPAGDSVTLTASAIGTQPLTWQWYLGNTPVSGATNDTLSFDAIESPQAGIYTVKVSNGGGTTTSASAPVVVFTPPVDQTVRAKSNATFRVTVSGPGPIGYQWLYEGEPVSGGTKSTLALTSVSLGQGGLYSVILSNAFLRATSPPALLTVQMAPTIVAAPEAVSAPEGEAVQLGVLALGSEPLTYQWRFQGTNLTGETSSTLSLDPLASEHAGYYSVVVANEFGSVTSAAVPVMVEGPEVAQLAIDSTETFAGGTVSLPVSLSANGDENTLALSLQFDPDLLSLVTVVNGTALGTDAGVIVNSAGSTQGRLGLLMALPPGAAFPPGSNHLVTLQFKAATGLAQAATTSIDFGDVPIARGLLSVSGRPLKALYESGVVTLEAGLEGDVSPSPSGDGELTLEDWSRIGQLVAGLANPADDSELVRADCAPLETLGDGILAAADWTQAGRYAAGIDAPRAAGGPVSQGSQASLHSDSEATLEGANALQVSEVRRPGLRLAGNLTSRRWEAVNVRALAGEPVRIPIRLHAAGDENTAGFTLTVDPTRARIRGVRRGNGLPEASVLMLNTNQTARGRLGVLLARPAGSRFAAGTHEVLEVDLELTGTQSVTLGFGDALVKRELVSLNAQVLGAEYVPGLIERVDLVASATPRQPLRLRSGALLMRWDAGRPGRYVLEASADLQTWTPVTEWNVLSPATLEYQDPGVGQTQRRFFRMR